MRFLKRPKTALFLALLLTILLWRVPYAFQSRLPPRLDEVIDIDTFQNDPHAPFKVEFVKVYGPKGGNLSVVFRLTNLTDKPLYARAADADFDLNPPLPSIPLPSVFEVINCNLLTESGTSSWNLDFINPHSSHDLDVAFIWNYSGPIPKGTYKVKYLFSVPYVSNHGYAGILPENAKWIEVKQKEMNIRLWYMNHTEGTFKAKGVFTYEAM